MSLKDKLSLLFVGTLVKDIILDVEDFPLEDSKIRTAKPHAVKIGGNVANSARVASRFSSLFDVTLCVPWPSSSLNSIDEALLETELENVHLRRLCVPGTTSLSTSFILRSSRNGSRTVITDAALPDPSFESLLDFMMPSFSDARKHFDWIHFEGRNGREIEKLLNHLLHQEGKHTYLSMEWEKVRSDFDLTLFLPRLDVVFISKAFMVSYNNNCTIAAADELINISTIEACFKKTIETLLVGSASSSSSQSQARERNTILVMPIGALGCLVCESNKGTTGVTRLPAVHIDGALDSIGAGDTFIAAFLLKFLKSRDPIASATFANRVAGRKILSEGFRSFLVSDMQASELV